MPPPQPRPHPSRTQQHPSECRTPSVCDSDINVGLAASNERLLEAICHPDSGGGGGGGGGSGESGGGGGGGGGGEGGGRGRGEGEPQLDPGAVAVNVMDAFAWATDELATTVAPTERCAKYDDVVHHSLLTVSFVGAWLRDVCGDGVYH